MPKVSVIIPTYNRAEYIAEAIQSVQQQTFKDVEIIVADDGSTNHTAEVVTEIGRGVTYLPLPHRGQPAATRNAGLRVAKGEFIAFLDSDDLFLPHKLVTQLAAFEAYPEAGMVYSNGYFFRDDRSEQPDGHVLDGLPTPSGQAFSDLLRGNFLFPAVVLVRRSCLDAVGFFDENPDFFGVEDYDLWLRLAAQFPFLYVPGDVAAIRRHEGSISRDITVHKKRVLLVLRKTGCLYPDLMRRYRIQRCEAHARIHGGIALAQLKQGRVIHSLLHGFYAMTYLSRIPRKGIQEFIAWWRRREQRRAAQP